MEQSGVEKGKGRDTDTLLSVAIIPTTKHGTREKGVRSVANGRTFAKAKARTQTSTPLRGVTNNRGGGDDSKPYGKLEYGRHKDALALVQHMRGRYKSAHMRYDRVDVMDVQMSARERIKLAGQLHRRRREGVFHAFGEAVQRDSSGETGASATVAPTADRRSAEARTITGRHPAASRCLTPLDEIHATRSPGAETLGGCNAGETLSNFQQRYPDTVSGIRKISLPEDSREKHPFWNAQRLAEEDAVQPGVPPRTFPKADFRRSRKHTKEILEKMGLWDDYLAQPYRKDTHRINQPLGRK